MKNFKEKVSALKGPIVVFGSTGFIGCNLFEVIFRNRDDCYAITHNPRSAWRLKLMGVPDDRIRHCDITYKKSVDSLMDELRPKTVFNLSAYGAYSKQDSTNLIYETNVIGALNILEACDSVEAYIQAGSSSEYGLNSESPSEDGRLAPNSHYSVSKISAAYLVDYYARFKGVPALNLRLYSIYGPWEEPDRLIPRLIERGLEGGFPPLVNPETTRDFVYIEDCVDAFIQAALKVGPDTAGRSINIASGVMTSLQELSELSRSIFRIEATPEWGSMPNRAWDTPKWYGDNRLALESIDWRPSIPLKEGLTMTAQWQRDIGYKNRVLRYFNQPSDLVKISPIIACYKDEKAIPIMYERLTKTFREIGCNYEIIFVNDDSPDNTQEVLESICQKDSNVIAIKHSRNFGSQAAFISGMEIASGDAVVLMDGDLQDPPEMIADFFLQWKKGYQVVYGRRVRREASRFMNFAYKLFYRMLNRMSDIKIPHDAGDFSLIDRKAVDHLTSLPEKDQCIRGLRAWIGFSQIGVDYVRPERMFGTSTNNLRKNLWWAKKGIFSFSYLPLEIMSYMGILLTTLSILFIFFQIAATLMFDDIPRGIPTVIVLVVFFGGINLLAVSILGEYLSKVVDETKSRPKFIRDKVILKGRVIETNAELRNLRGNS